MSLSNVTYLAMDGTNLLPFVRATVSNNKVDVRCFRFAAPTDALVAPTFFSAFAFLLVNRRDSGGEKLDTHKDET